MVQEREREGELEGEIYTEERYHASGKKEEVKTDGGARERENQRGRGILGRDITPLVNKRKREREGGVRGRDMLRRDITPLANKRKERKMVVQERGKQEEGKVFFFPISRSRHRVLSGYKLYLVVQRRGRFRGRERCRGEISRLWQTRGRKGIVYPNK